MRYRKKAHSHTLSHTLLGPAAARYLLSRGRKAFRPAPSLTLVPEGR